MSGWFSKINGFYSLKYQLYNPMNSPQTLSAPSTLYTYLGKNQTYSTLITLFITALKEPNLNNPQRQLGAGLLQYFCSSEGAEYNC
jgi:hypothetical protein